MSRLWLVVIEDAKGDMEPEAAAKEYIAALIDSEQSGLKVREVRRGGLLARKVLDELPPVRHKDQGVYR